MVELCGAEYVSRSPRVYTLPVTASWRVSGPDRSTLFYIIFPGSILTLLALPWCCQGRA